MKSNLPDGPCCLDGIYDKNNHKENKMATKELKKVSGKVNGVGTRFNGSILLNDTWYNFAKGVINTAEKGDSVTIELENWEYKGKTGVNIVGLTFNQDPKEVAQQTLIEAKSNLQSETKGRDFDSENRGKVRHGLMVSLMPLVATESLTLEKAKELVNQVTEFVMKGK